MVSEWCRMGFALVAVIVIVVIVIAAVAVVAAGWPVRVQHALRRVVSCRVMRVTSHTHGDEMRSVYPPLMVTMTTHKDRCECVHRLALYSPE